MIRCGDEGFQVWVLDMMAKETGLDSWSSWAFPEYVRAQAAAIAVRETCKVKSRSELDTNPEAAARWRALDQRFMTETGRTTEERS